MKFKYKKLYLQSRKRKRKSISGSNERPRLSVFKSNKHIYAQLIDDINQVTLLSSSTLAKNLRTTLTQKSKFTNALIVGQTLGNQALLKDITTIFFDRGKQKYLGSIKNLVEGIRSTGIKI